MSDKFQNKYRIPSARATFHDYDGGAYFITICTAGMEHYFGEISGSEMKYSKMGLFAVKQIENSTLHYPYAEIPLYVVMPNHIHLIIFIDSADRRDAIHRVSDNNRNENQSNIIKPDAMNLDAINSDTINRVSTVGGITGKKNPMLQDNLARVIRWYKGSISFYARKMNSNFAWQTRYHDRIVRDRHEMNRIAEYIENNVINWELDEYNKL
ncbi:transposase [Petrimonas sp.]|uniref:transposase n=1 Tax=Petrimonas sp. TaxID=2023866 RepID=UPI003F517D53